MGSTGSDTSESRRRISGDDGLVMAIEMVVTPLLFAAAGFGLDTWLGTRPWFTAILGAVAFAGKVVGEWYRYTNRMTQHEAGITAGRQTQRRGLRRNLVQRDGAPAAESVGLPTGITLEAESSQVEPLEAESSQVEPLEAESQ